MYWCENGVECPTSDLPFIGGTAGEISSLCKFDWWWSNSSFFLLVQTPGCILDHFSNPRLFSSSKYRLHQAKIKMAPRIYKVKLTSLRFCALTTGYISVYHMTPLDFSGTKNTHFSILFLCHSIFPKTNLQPTVNYVTMISNQFFLSHDYHLGTIIQSQGRLYLNLHHHEGAKKNYILFTHILAPLESAISLFNVKIMNHKIELQPFILKIFQGP